MNPDDTPEADTEPKGDEKKGQPTPKPKPEPPKGDPVERLRESDASGTRRT